MNRYNDQPEMAIGESIYLDSFWLLAGGGEVVGAFSWGECGQGITDGQTRRPAVWTGFPNVRQLAPDRQDGTRR
jgi:hypothetical protein